MESVRAQASIWSAASARIGHVTLSSLVAVHSPVVADVGAPVPAPGGFGELRSEPRVVLRVGEGFLELGANASPDQQ